MTVNFAHENNSAGALIRKNTVNLITSLLGTPGNRLNVFVLTGNCYELESLAYICIYFKGN